jgi:hypothetical protein
MTMVKLKTKAQVKSFIKRMSKKFNYHYREGCGCCWNSDYVQIDVKKHRVILVHQTSYADDVYTSVKVLAILPRTYHP